MYRSSVFDHALRSLGENPASFMANLGADDLLVSISTLALWEDDNPQSSGSAVTDLLLAFGSYEYLRDFGARARASPRRRDRTVRPRL